jgi:surface polysaccharide O-acyltransferase-like enzyme
MQAYDFRISLCRAVSCFLVIVIHMAAVNFYTFNPQWAATNFYDSLARGAVPLFLMISGAVLLGKQEPLSVYFRKRFLRIFPALVVWSFVYLSWLDFVGAKTPSNWLLAMFTGPVKSHLWFMYIIIGLYAAVPILRRFYQHATDTEKLYFVVMWLLVTCIYPTWRNTFGLTWNFAGSYHLYQFVGYGGYMVLGAWLYELAGRGRAGKPSHALFLFFGGSLLIMLYTYWYSTERGKPHELFYDNLSLFCVMASMGLFRFLLATPTSSNPLFVKSVNLISDCSLGIYCIHILVRDAMYRYTGFSGATPSAWWSVPVSTVVVLLVSLALVAAARKVRPLRYIT